MKKTYTFLLNFGYVENSGLSYVSVTSRGKSASAKEALIDLAVFLKERYCAKHVSPLRKCCNESRAKNDEAKFCSKCGRLLEIGEFDPEDYMEFVSRLDGCDVDTFHSDIMEWDESYRWQFEGEGLEAAIKNSTVRIVYQAERVLAAAIGHSSDNRVTIDTIFSNRTRSKNGSFSFYS